MSSTYNSLLKRYVTELYAGKAIKELFTETNMQILNELSEVM